VGAAGPVVRVDCVDCQEEVDRGAVLELGLWGGVGCVCGCGGCRGQRKEVVTSCACMAVGLCKADGRV
jgi:hypothetical protein